MRFNRGVHVKVQCPENVLKICEKLKCDDAYLIGKYVPECIVFEQFVIFFKNVRK